MKSSSNESIVIVLYLIDVIYHASSPNYYQLLCNLVWYHSGFSVSPGVVWVLETKRQYVITVDIFDKLNHRLYVAEVFIVSQFIS
jgi:hypothetical protein